MEPTWDYMSDMYDDGEPPLDIIWSRLRAQRDRLLTASDFRMVSDAPWSTAPWETYRQALRDLPENTTDPRTAPWPTPPTV